MINLIIAFSQVVFFCLSARMLIGTFLQPIDLVRRGEFSVRALRIEKHYKTFAWGMMSLALFIFMVSSFIQAFTEMN